MDILIKNVDDANGKRCFDCEFEYKFCCELLFATNVDGLLEDDVLEKKKDRDRRCPMIILPPHGRLCDLDALIEHETYNIEQALFDSDEVLEDLKNAPVIVEANNG